MMDDQQCQQCPPLEVCTSDAGDTAHSPELRGLRPHRLTTLEPRPGRVTIIYAKADSVRDCPECRQRFVDVFKIPDFWWTKWCRQSNGYFGCDETTDDNGELDGYNTWLRILVKQVLEDPPAGRKDYVWHKFNVFTRWTPVTHATTVIIFDPRLIATDQFLSSLVRHLDAASLSDPFWIHVRLAEEAISQQDTAVWNVRKLVRMIEMNRESPSAPNPDYARLHDGARHTIHVSETLDIGLHTMEQIIKHHNSFLADHPSVDKKIKNARTRLQHHLAFCQHMWYSLRGRAGANKARLKEEIQLAFHTVAQYDSQIAVELGRVTQYDSFAMKSLAFLTLTFLPATFISALFSMSFFSFDPDSGWVVSDKFWIYFAVAAPVTLFTVLLWLYWPRFFPPDVVGHVHLRPRGEDIERARQEMARRKTIKSRKSMMSKLEYGHEMVSV